MFACCNTCLQEESHQQECAQKLCSATLIYSYMLTEQHRIQLQITYSLSIMLTSPRLSPAACFHNRPVEHALHNVSSSLHFLCPTLGKTQEKLEFETQMLL